MKIWYQNFLDPVKIRINTKHLIVSSLADGTKLCVN